MYEIILMFNAYSYVTSQLFTHTSRYFLVKILSIDIVIANA